MRLVVVGRGEVGLVGCDDGQLERVRELQKLRLHVVLRLEAVALDLDVKPVPEGRFEGLQARGGQFVLSLAQRAVNGTVGAAGERDETVGALAERRCRRMCHLRVGRIEMRAAHQPHQVGVAHIAHGEERNGTVARLALRHRRPFHGIGAALCEVNVERHADDGLDARVGELVGELERAEKVVRIREPQRGKPVRGGKLGELGDRQRAFEQRVGGVHLEMHERCRCGGAAGE